jgi:hypothetical protein
VVRDKGKQVHSPELGARLNATLSAGKRGNMATDEVEIAIANQIALAIERSNDGQPCFKVMRNPQNGEITAPHFTAEWQDYV